MLYTLYAPQNQYVLLAHYNQLLCAPIRSRAIGMRCISVLLGHANVTCHGLLTVTSSTLVYFPTPIGMRHFMMLWF
jgi:hypothetical protein